MAVIRIEISIRSNYKNRLTFQTMINRYDLGELPLYCCYYCSQLIS